MCWNYLLHDVGHAVVKVLLRVDGCAVIVHVLPAVVLDEQLFEGQGALLLVGHHQLVTEAEQNELKRKQTDTLELPGSEAARKCCTIQVLNPLIIPHLSCFLLAA